MKYNSALISEGRNKLGDAVFARNPSGNYIRARVKPANPQTIAQQAWRANFSMFTKQWRTLTPTQMQGWNTIASSIVKHDTLGQTYHPTGIDTFVSCNLNIASVGQPQITDPPTDTTIPDNFVFYGLYEVEYADGEALYEFGCGFPAAGILQQQTCMITNGFSPGINFVPPFFYRAGLGYANPGSPVFGFVIYDYAALANFANGNKISFGTRAVNPFTGFASKLSTVTTLITGL